MLISQAAQKWSGRHPKTTQMTLDMDLMGTLFQIPTDGITPSPGSVPSSHLPEWYCGPESLHHSRSTDVSQGEHHSSPRAQQVGRRMEASLYTPSRLQKIAHLAGCDHNSTKVMVECLRSLSAEEVTLVSKRMVRTTCQLPSLSACML